MLSLGSNYCLIFETSWSFPRKNKKMEGCVTCFFRKRFRLVRYRRRSWGSVKSVAGSSRSSRQESIWTRYFSVSNEFFDFDRQAKLFSGSQIAFETDSPHLYSLNKINSQGRAAVKTWGAIDNEIESCFLNLKFCDNFETLEIPNRFWTSSQQRRLDFNKVRIIIMISSPTILVL